MGHRSPGSVGGRARNFVDHGVLGVLKVSALFLLPALLLFGGVDLANSWH